LHRGCGFVAARGDSFSKRRDKAQLGKHGHMGACYSTPTRDRAQPVDNRGATGRRSRGGRVTRQFFVLHFAWGGIQLVGRQSSQSGLALPMQGYEWCRHDEPSSS
jgi:hypothetical protein